MGKENYIKLINQKLSEYSHSLLSSDHDPLFLVEQSDLVNICKILRLIMNSIIQSLLIFVLLTI